MRYMLALVGATLVASGSVAIAQPEGPQEESLELNRLKSDLGALADERHKMQAEFRGISEALIPLQMKILQLQKEIAASDRAIREKATLMAQLQNGIQRPMSNQTRAAVDAINQNIIAGINQLSNEVLSIRTAMQPVRDELGSAQQELAEQVARRTTLEAQLSASYERWRIILSPIHENVAEKVVVLRQVYAHCADVPELGLWLAAALFYDGKDGEAAETLDTVDRVISSAATVCLPVTSWEFVYLSLVIDKSEVANKRYVRFCQASPKSAQLMHLQAVKAMREKGFAIAKSKFKQALKLAGAERNLLLNSDAAWFFAAAPTESLRDFDLAQACADNVHRCSESGTHNEFRSRAALAAHEEDWQSALKHLETARRCCPKSLLQEIDDQAAAYSNEEQFAIQVDRK